VLAEDLDSLGPFAPVPPEPAEHVDDDDVDFVALYGSHEELVPGTVLAVGGRLVVVPEAAPLQRDSAPFGQLCGVLAFTDDTVFFAIIRLADALV